MKNSDSYNKFRRRLANDTNESNGSNSTNGSKPGNSTKKDVG